MACGSFFRRRGGFPRFPDLDDFRGGMKWIVALRAACVGEIELNFISYFLFLISCFRVADLSKPGSDR